MFNVHETCSKRGSKQRLVLQGEIARQLIQKPAAQISFGDLFGSFKKSVHFKEMDLIALRIEMSVVLKDMSEVDKAIVITGDLSSNSSSVRIHKNFLPTVRRSRMHQLGYLK
jgi:hypothetical protein